jgi:hypothetical protein
VWSASSSVLCLSARALADGLQFCDFVFLISPDHLKKVVDLFNTFLESIYSQILVGYSGSYEFLKLLCVLSVSLLVQNLFQVVLRNF